MGKLAAILLFFASSLALPAQTLREQLAAQEISDRSFSAADLDEMVVSADASDAHATFVAYLKLRYLTNAGDPTVVRMNRQTGAVVRAEIPVARKLAEVLAADAKTVAGQKDKTPKEKCCSALSALRFIGEYVVLTAQLSSGSTAQIVLSRNLKLIEILHGQELIEVAPGVVVSDREASQRPVFHADRLDVSNLQSGAKQQLYPVAGDRLREIFTGQVERAMPEKVNCLPGDPCDFELYDDTLTFLGSNHAGLFAFFSNRSADHTASSGEITAQTALYLYSLGAQGWRYCQQELNDDEAEAADASPSRDFKALSARCTPNLPVEPISTKAQTAAPESGADAPPQP